MTRALTVNEVADLTRVHPGTIRREIHAGRLPAFRTSPGPRSPLRIDPEDFRRWRESCKIDNTETGKLTKIGR